MTAKRFLKHLMTFVPKLLGTRDWDIFNAMGGKGVGYTIVRAPSLQRGTINEFSELVFSTKVKALTSSVTFSEGSPPDLSENTSFRTGNLSVFKKPSA